MYELCCRVVHCRGEVVRVIGCVESLAEAEAWLNGPPEGELRTGFRGMNEELRRTVPVCRASSCPLRSQRPQFFYRHV